MKRKQICSLIASLLLSAGADVAALPSAQSTAFTYQGQISAAHFPLGGQTLYFTFTLYDAVSAGNIIAQPVEQTIVIANGGIFTTDLDFGQVFNGAQYWLEIKVGSTQLNEEALIERQPVNVVPVAQYALNSPAGKTGPTGATGPAGGTGATGVGATGADGSAGPMGATGTNGTVGATGATGTAGATGATGPSGLAGAVGATGAAGVNGALGMTGAAGLAGPTGAIGATGSGIAGSNGDAGATGAAGSQGPQGIAGSNGDPGKVGEQGQQGLSGATGATGLAWQGTWIGGEEPHIYTTNDAVAFNGSSYISLVDDNAGNPPDIDVADALGNWSLLAQQGGVGATGSSGSGATGEAGPQGADGSPGATGQQGDQGKQGEQGPQGFAGAQGSQGFPGDQGPQGPQGDLGFQGDQGATGATGAQGLTWQGTWNSEASYAVNDAVAFAGSSYISVSSNNGPGNDPPDSNTDGWTLIAQKGDRGFPGFSGACEFADFYAMMPQDNEESVAVGANVQFPQNGPASGGIFRDSDSTFLLPSNGTYQVAFQVSVSEPGQLILKLNGLDLDFTVVGRGTGDGQIVGTSLIFASSGDELSLTNPDGNSTPLTITPSAGGTRAVSAHLVITQVRSGPSGC